MHDTKRSVFVSFHHQGDQWYYDEFSRIFSEHYDVVRDRSVDRLIDSDDPEYVFRRIREDHIAGSSCTVVLCGFGTPWRKYVDWEIKATLDKKHGLIGINLPSNLPNNDGVYTVPDRLSDNIQSGFALWLNWSDIMREYSHLKRCIEDANSRSTSLIINDRDMMSRNG